MASDGSTSNNGLADKLMRLLWRRPAATAAESARRRVTVYLIPYLFFLYILAYLDRVNISVAGLDMEKPVSDGGMAFDRSIIGFGAGIFFLGYFLFEVPSNLVLDKVGARIWIARVMITWGLISGAMAFVQGPNSFYALRFLLDAAEAGFNGRAHSIGLCALVDNSRSLATTQVQINSAKSQCVGMRFRPIDRVERQFLVRLRSVLQRQQALLP